MKLDYSKHSSPPFKRPPFWKGLVIIIVIVAMPLFFSFDRDVEIQQTLTPDERELPSDNPIEKEST